MSTDMEENEPLVGILQELQIRVQLTLKVRVNKLVLLPLDCTIFYSIISLRLILKKKLSEQWKLLEVIDVTIESYKYN